MKRVTRADIARDLIVRILARTSAHPKFAERLERLASTGLYGHNELEALVRLAEERAREVLPASFPPSRVLR